MGVSTALDADNPEETKTLPPADPHAVFNTLSDLETHKHPKHGFLLSGNRVIRELLNPIEFIPPFSSPTPPNHHKQGLAVPSATFPHDYRIGQPINRPSLISFWTVAPFPNNVERRCSVLLFVR